MRQQSERSWMRSISQICLAVKYKIFFYLSNMDLCAYFFILITFKHEVDFN